MIVVCLACAVVSVLLFTGSPVERRATTRLARSEPRSGDLGGRGRPAAAHWVLGAGALSSAVALVLAHRWAGLPGVSVTVAGLVVLGTSLRLAVGARQQRAAARARVEVAHGCSVLASQIRVGLVPAEALRDAVEDCPVLAAASRVQDLGGDVTAVWRSESALPGHGGLADLARAWQVSVQTGAPMARNLEQAADSLTADVALRAVVAGELSAPRATGKIMAALPLCGLGMGYLLGGDPVTFLLSNPYGWACLDLGVALAAAGVLWIDGLARRAADQGV